MDRRQRKSREAILSAFIDLLSDKQFGQITVAEIIERADVGRATFYAHFETKDFLLRTLCEEIFGHVFDATRQITHPHARLDCTAQGSFFLHLFLHLQRNDNHILDLLKSGNNDLFLGYFKSGLGELIRVRFEEIGLPSAEGVPRDFLINHVAATFVEAVRWWIDHKMQEPPEQITEYFLRALSAGQRT